ncbi:MAG: indole-3-glycerol phosphate synthase TrpC [Candidatus Firestonebacteria bacterium]|nr:indole-3-glycerol phosphate synthase TrpC [Candidatus Firestonebacteria bacterium]
MDFLEEIVQYKKNEIRERKSLYPLHELKKEIYPQKKAVMKFRDAISISDRLNLIAEIKKASPSRGIIRSPFNPEEIARAYASCCVSAISVLTEEKYFQGNIQYLRDIQAITTIPLLMKDFIIDEYQIYEARKYGASAILLIAAILTENQINNFMNIAKLLDLDCLVEVHNEEELEKVLNLNALIIGINNRDLKTFHVDINTSFKLKEKIQSDKIVVCESGIKNNNDMIKLKASGFNAVLIGETFMKSLDIAAKIKEIWNC